MEKTIEQIVSDAVKAKNQRDQELKDTQEQQELKDRQYAVHIALSEIAVPIAERIMSSLKGTGIASRVEIRYDQINPDCISEVLLIVSKNGCNSENKAPLRVGVHPELWAHSAKFASIIRTDIFKPGGRLDSSIEIETENMTEEVFMSQAEKFIDMALL